jgi:hypothetical protein
MKAWKCSGWAEEEMVIVYAPTRNAARHLASRALTDEEYVNVVAYRYPEADAHFISGRSVLDWQSLEDRRIYRSLGWRAEDTREVCEGCGLGDFGEAEFAVCPVCELCPECQPENHSAGCKPWTRGGGGDAKLP